MKMIVTHFNPDLDALTSIWLIKRLMKGWEDTEVSFVPAGSTYQNLKPDENDNILHVDTGFGRFDHHNTDEDICAAGLVWEQIKRIKNYESLQLDSGQVGIKNRNDEEAVERLVKIVNDIDHFKEVYWPEPSADYYDFNLERILDGWKILYPNENLRFVEWGLDCLDGVLATFKNKVWAEEELLKGKVFETKWGKAIGLETVNDEVIHLGQKKGFVLVVRKDPRKDYLRIKSRPEKNIDLTFIFEKLKEKDPKATWFLHASKHMILNGSTKNPETRATRLSLEDVVEIIKNC